jgi:hypothetical protein
MVREANEESNLKASRIMVHHNSKYKQSFALALERIRNN